MPQEAFAYIRVSGESQAGGDGPARQRRVISAWAKRTKTKLLQEFADLGVSGTKGIESRPQMRAMYDALKASGGLPPIVVVERADRLARDLIAGEIILQRLRELGVRIVIAENGQEMAADDTPTGKLIRQVLGAVNEFDKSSIVEKLRASRVAARQKHGRCEGRKPYGSRPGEAEGLELMLASQREGLSLAQIAVRLEAAGIPARGSQKAGPKPWARSSIAKILAAHSNVGRKSKRQAAK